MGRLRIWTGQSPPAPQPQARPSKAPIMRGAFFLDTRSDTMPRRFPPPWSIEKKLSFSARWHRCHNPRNYDLRPGDNYSQASNNSELASTIHAVG